MSGIFWTNGDLTIYRHCDGVYELTYKDASVMEPCSFDLCARYAWAEFEVWG